MNTFLKINIGGKTFTTQKTTFLTKCIPNYFSAYLQFKPDISYIFLDRNPKYFEIILDHVRGYTTTLPTDEGDLVKLYEDVIFYGIQTLVAPLEEVLELRIPDLNREKIKNYIRSKIHDYNMTNFIPTLQILDQL